MGVQEVQSAKEAPAYQKKKKAGSAEGFQESLLQNLRSREQEQEEAADTAQGSNRTKRPSETARIGVTGGVRVNTAMLTEAVQTAKVQHMRYEESDHVEIAVAEGYTLKGKHMEKGDRVYVEAKYDDGRLEAYQVDVERISQDTTHTIERFALETMREA
ncbi:MAG: hypothetical protein K2M22_01195 [Lachnospiraceae bacterium]|nr:hypothetical protein [Lachnospiraceae bacterium]MDE7176374.1 hypothetical protein [Lachnospiraceae bacterium]